MENGLSVIDFKQFFKQKKGTVVTIMLIVSIVFAGVTLYQSFREVNTSGDDTEVSEEESEDQSVRDLLERDPEELSANELAVIDDYLFEEAYAFRFYVENVDGSVFARTNLLEQVFLSEDVLSMIEEETQTDLTIIEDYFLDLDYNSTNVVFTLTIGTGDAELSAAISQIYFDALSDGTLPVLDDKLVFLFENQPLSVQSEEAMEELSAPEETNDIAWVDVLINGIAGLFIGLGFGMMAAYLQGVYQSKVHPLFNLNLLSKDMYINLTDGRVSKEVDYSELKQVIAYPEGKEKLVVAQNPDVIQSLKDVFLKTQPAGIEIQENVYAAKPASDIDEVIIIIEDNETDKKWYRKQKTNSKLFKSEIKIIKI